MVGVSDITDSSRSVSAAGGMSSFGIDIDGFLGGGDFGGGVGGGVNCG
jgi:hypothetical protein